MSDVKDLEKGNEAIVAPAEEQALHNDSERKDTAGADQVDWDGPDDQENPFNWPRWKKMRQLVLMAFNTFIT